MSILNADTGEEQLITLDIPEDAEWFGPCCISPDDLYLTYLQAGGRISEQGRVLMSARIALMIPTWSNTAEFERMIDFEDPWESCPVWLVK